MIKSVSNLWNHKLFVSVAITETGGVHTLKLRSAWLVFACIFAVSGWLGMAVAGDLATARLTATITGNSEMQYYLNMISDLRSQRDAEREQVRLIAQELGVLQARLDRFDALGEKLKAEGTLISEADASTGGKGGPEIDDSQPLPSMDEVRRQLGIITNQADFTEMALETSMAMAIRKALGPSLDQTIPYLWPLITANHRLSSPFGYRSDPFHTFKAWHAGMDIADATGSPVTAAADGVVTFVGWRMGYGNLVEIKHSNGFVTRYGHLFKGIAKEGQRVAAGDLVALLGSTGRSTGPHLHFEIRKDGKPLNPYPFIRETRAEVIALARQGRGNELLAAWRKGGKTRTASR